MIMDFELPEPAHINFMELGIPKLELREYKRRYDEDMDFRDNFKKDLTTEFIEEAKYRKEHEKNNIWDIYGLPGDTKSFTGFSLTAMCRLPLDIEDVYFRLEEVNRRMAQIKKNSMVIRDERTPVYGVGEKRLEAEYVTMLETLRSRGINFMVIAVPPRLVDHAFYFIQALGLVDYEKEISIVELQDKQRRTMGHLKVLHPFKTIGKKFINEYLIQKDEFQSTVQHQKSTDYLSEYAYQVIDTEKFKEVEHESILKAKKCNRPYTGIKNFALKELVNLKFPELRRNNEADVVVDKIKSIGMLERKWQNW